MKTHAQAGFSLVELMVAATIGLLIFAALITIFVQTNAARAELERTSEQVDNGRYAVEVLSQDLQLAGYYGELDIAGIALPAGLPDLCSTDPAVWLTAIGLHAQGFDEGAGVPGCVPGSIKAGTDVVAVRRVRTCVAGTAGCDAVVPADPYLQVSLCGTSNMYLLGPADATNFTLTLKDCAAIAGLRRYVVHTYFVSNDNGSGRNVPTLKRIELSAAGFTEVPLVEGIERLQIQYGIDIDGDGAPDGYSSDPATFAPAGCAGCNPVSNWANVVTANVYVLARTLELSPSYTDTKIYELGADATGAPITAGPFGDKYRRHVYSAAVRLMNPSGRKDKP